MGIFSDIKAIKDVQKIKDGKSTANLSISQITGLITNMTDARNNLSVEEFKEVYDLFNKLRSCNTKMKMNLEGYLETCMDIIKKFDAIAPYEKYSGGNEMEFSFLMNDIRKSSASNIENTQTFSKEELDYINTMVSSSNGMIDESDAKDLMKVLKLYAISGKEKVLEEFEVVAKKIIDRSGAVMSISKISFLLGVLNSNGVVDVNEMNRLSEKYQNECLNLMMKDK